MSKYNKVSAGTKTVNLAGGEAYKQTNELELVSLLVTSFLKDQFYRSEKDITQRLDYLIDNLDPVFTAKASLLARHEFATRSVTHYVAASLAHKVHGTNWARKYFKKIVRRPDDALEILACYMNKFGKESPIPNALKRGLGDALSEMSEYSLGKYAKSNSELKMVDLINLVHPKHTEALRTLIKGELASPETWEVEISRAGSDLALKALAWGNLVIGHKLGYMALIRNIRNILDVDSKGVLIGNLCEQLQNEDSIKKSLILPFRFNTALQVIESDCSNHRYARDIVNALSNAIDISLNNVPKFDESTVVVLDESGSMGKVLIAGTPANIGSLFAASIVKASNADLVTFSDRAKYHLYNKNDSTLSIARSIKFNHGGTNFHSIFQTLNQAYDRIIILSDMQGWIGYNSPVKTFNHYKSLYDCDPFIYSWDLKGYGNMQFPEKNVYCIAGLNDRVFQIMNYLESDKDAFVNVVKLYPLE